MKKLEVTMVRTDEVQVELDEEYFDEAWFEEFREVFYDKYTLEELAEYIIYNIVHNNQTHVDGIGIPLRDGKRPYWISDTMEVNKHVNVVYNQYDTDVEFE